MAVRPTVKPSFDKHIRLMFRSIDILHMGQRFDLRAYEDVKAFSNDILERLKELDNRKVMPPIEDGGPWPEEWIALFERWIDAGYPR